MILLAIADVMAEPVATFQESSWNFGEIQYGESVEKEFDMANTGSDELKIRRIQPGILVFVSMWLFAFLLHNFK